MRISDRYIGRQVFTGTIMAVVLLCVILIMGVLFQKVHEILVQSQAPPELLLKFILYNLPAPLMFALPLGFLVTVLLVVGRLSGQNEMVGFRTSGTSLIRLTAPIFALGIFFSLICWFLSGVISPTAKKNTRKLIHDTLKQGDAIASLSAGSEIKHPGFQAFITEKEGDTLKGFHLYGLAEDKNGVETPQTYVYATSVDLKVAESKEGLILSFEDAFIEQFNSKEKGGSKFITASTAEPWPLAVGSKGIPDKPSFRTNFTLFKQLGEPLSQHHLNRVLAELQKRHALTLACFSFAFIGIPLGITSQRRETVSGLVTALIIALIYFVLLLVAEDFDDTPIVCSAMMWLPNLLCIVFGSHLLRRASRR